MRRLTRAHNDVLQAIDNNRCVVLILLDLSAAFGTVDHTILPQRLHCRFVFKGKVLDWFRSSLRSKSFSGAPNENIIQNHLNIALLNVF